MHEHADKLDDINFALDDGDLERASIPAFWMARHPTLDRIPRKWHTYVTGMRAAAQDVEYATDLDTARAAAKRISEQCQGCHTAAGIKTAL
jgi:mono/diheme cytochrome c family protein